MESYNRRTIHSDKKDSVFQVKSLFQPELKTQNHHYTIRLAQVREHQSILIVEKQDGRYEILAVRELKANQRNILDLELADHSEQGKGLFDILGSIRESSQRPSKNDKIAKINNIYMDALGYHALFSTSSTDNYYCNSIMHQVKPLPKLQEHLTAVAFNLQSSPMRESTGEILIGTKEGKIILYKIEKLKNDEAHESILTKLFSLSTNDQIKHLFSFSRFDQHRQPQTFVLALAQSPNHQKTHSLIFEGPRGESSYQVLFQPYEKKEIKGLSIPPPSPQTRGILAHLYFSNSPTVAASSLIYTEGNIINLIKLSPLHEQPRFNETKYLAYFRNEDDDQKGYHLKDMPLGILTTDLHYCLLFPDCLLVISQITEKVVQTVKIYKERLIQGKSQQERALSMHFNHKTKQVVVVTTFQLLALQILNEDHDAWRTYVLLNKLQEAYQVCERYNSPKLSYVAGLYGNHLLEQPDREIDAAKMLFHSNVPFEQAVLGFMKAQRDAAHQMMKSNLGSTDKAEKAYRKAQRQLGLQEYLHLWLDHQKKKGGSPASQKVLLAYLTELKLFELNSLESETLYSGRDQLVKDMEERKKVFSEVKRKLMDFLHENKDLMHKETTQQLLVSHGRVEECLKYFEFKNDREAIIKHYINEENYQKAIQQLDKVKDNKDVLALLQNYVHVLLQKEPQLMMACLKKKLNSEMPFDFLIPYILDIPESHNDAAISFVKEMIEKRAGQGREQDTRALNNIYVYFLAQKDSYHEDLDRFLDEQTKEEKAPYFDKDFAFRMFSERDHTRGKMKILWMREMYKETVELALKEDMVKLAQHYASKHTSEEMQRTLWKLIARHLFDQKKPIEEIMSLTSQNKQLKIQDILPYFNGNINIGKFKDQLCNSLKEYDNEIETLQADMKGYERNVEQQNQELREMNSKYFVVESDKLCKECHELIFTSHADSYVFPCQHAFHRKCIDKRLLLLPTPIYDNYYSNYQKIKKDMDNIRLRYATTQENKKGGIIQSFLSRGHTEKNNDYSEEDNKMMGQLQDSLDSLLAAECPNCGSVMVDLIQQRFGDEQSISTWDI